MGVLLGFVVDELKVVVSRKTLWNYMEKHGFSYTLAIPRDVHRVDIKARDIIEFYDELERDFEGVNACLVFNMDEMGVELFPDRRKEVMVYVRPEQVRRHGPLFVGIPRTSRRCMLIACISLNGETLKGTIITRMKPVNSTVFEKGFS